MRPAVFKCGLPVVWLEGRESWTRGLVSFYSESASQPARVGTRVLPGET